MPDATPEDDTDLETETDDEFDEDFVAAADDDIEDVDVVDDDVVAVDDDPELEEVVPVKPAKSKAKSTSRAEDDDDDEEDDFDADDVEEDLGEILKARLATATDDDDDEDDETAALDSEDRSNNANRVRPKSPEEFVCQSCFLVKHPSQLADAEHQLCADCV